MSEKAIRVGPNLEATWNQGDRWWYIYYSSATLEVGYIYEQERSRPFLFESSIFAHTLTITDLRAIARFMVKLEKGTVTPMEEEDE